jgi:signal transduction histidine kinase
MQKISPETIIVVDDETESMSGMRDFLTELGYRVLGFVSGGEALNALREHRCDLIITDLMMPEMDGMTFMKRAKEIDPLMICMMVTGHATIQTAVDAMKEGAFDYITKPFDWKILRLVISRALEVRRLMHSEEQLRISRDQLRAFARRLAEAQERERLRIKQELHDGVGQDLIALGMNLDSLHDPLTDKHTGLTDQRLTDSRNILSELKQTIRHLIADIRPAVLDDFGVLAAIQSFSDTFSKRTGLRILVQGDEDMPRLPGLTEISLYRIVQEALTNVAKHARAENVSICLHQLGTTVLLEVVDDGVGFDPSLSRQANQTEAWGILNMCERSEAIGGTLRLESEKGKGTRVIVEIRI